MLIHYPYNDSPLTLELRDKDIFHYMKEYFCSKDDAVQILLEEFFGENSDEFIQFLCLYRSQYGGAS